MSHEHKDFSFSDNEITGDDTDFIRTVITMNIYHYVRNTIFRYNVSQRERRQRLLVFNVQGFPDLACCCRDYDLQQASARESEGEPVTKVDGRR